MPHDLDIDLDLDIDIDHDHDHDQDFGVPLKKTTSTKSAKTSKQSKPRPHVCSICTRAFARLEHLKRHERSHTNEKPFQCAACGRCFARRDLVLRHQQKLHASLPTNNRTNIQRKGRNQKSQYDDNGDIVRDYLNDNINIVRNNTSAKLPIANGDVSSTSPVAAAALQNFDSQQSVLTNSSPAHTGTGSGTGNHSSVSPYSESHQLNHHHHHQSLRKANEDTNGHPNHDNSHIHSETSPMIQPEQLSYLNGSQMMNSAIYNSPNSMNGIMFSPGLLTTNTNNRNNNNSNLNIASLNPFPSSSNMMNSLNPLTFNSATFDMTSAPNGVNVSHVNSNITPESQNKSNSNSNSQSNLKDAYHIDSDELDSDLDNDNIKFDNPQAMYSQENGDNDGDIDLNYQNNNSGSSSYRNQRHASFSAAASSSYTGLPDSKTPHDKNMAELESEAPQQVNFSSPQLKYKPNGELGYFDLDILDNIDLNDLGLDFSTFNFSGDLSNYNNHRQGMMLGGDGTTPAAVATTPAPTAATVATRNSHSATESPHTAENMSRSGSSSLQADMASPRGISLQRVLSNPQNGVALQKVLSHPRSGQALQKVLSHPNSDFALQRVLSHPEPNAVLERVLSHPSDTEWFNEFINAPIDTNFPAITDHIGFTDTPENADSPTLNVNTPSTILAQATGSGKGTEIQTGTGTGTGTTASTDTGTGIGSGTAGTNTGTIGGTSTMTGSIPDGIARVGSPSNANDLKYLFRSRQIDLFKHVPHTYQNPTIPGRCSEQIRQHIMKKYNLNEQQFPQLEDLNHYLALYESEFSKYFPFIHIPSFKIDENLNQIPLLLSMAAVGALYSFHARNSSTLFNFSRFLIHNFMEVQMKMHQFNDIPLHITQALVLHMFLGMFHNDMEITKLINRQLNSLVSLVKTTKLDMPLESLLIPPTITSDLSGSTNFELIESCYKYFVLAQSRIRTVHVLHYITVLYACLTNTKVEMSVKQIECGSPCASEELWNCRNYNEWILIMKEKNLVVNSKFTLIRLSNGHSYKELWRNMQNLALDKDIGLRGMLSLLMTMNEMIHSESMEIEKDDTKTDGAKLAEWRMEQRPYIESLIKTWESCYIRNGGVLVPRGQNVHTIYNSSVLKLTLPLLSFAKINKCVYISSVLAHVWNRKWDLMNSEIKRLTRDVEALRDSINYSLDIINLWIEIISINNDAEKTSIRTPIFFLTCLFTSTLLISEYLYTTEAWAYKYLSLDSAVSSRAQTHLTTSDRVLWLRAEKIFKKIEKNLLPIGSNNQSYSEFLRVQANGALDVDILDDEIARLALEPGDLKPIAEIIVSGRLSTRCLSLGVRILADAPVWPMALLFAEALKARAIDIHQCTSKWTPNPTPSPAKHENAGSL
jgi:hypothetical protein